MKYIRFFAAFPFLVLVFAGCKVNDTPTTADENRQTITTTTIAGVVNDEAGRPLPGVVVSVTENGAVKNSTTTDKFGSFMIPNANVPSSRCFILCKKNGYFTGSRAEIPNTGRITEMRLTMQSNMVTHTVSASFGGKITVGAASINLPSNAFVSNSGTPYIGKVNIAAKFLDPTTQTFYNSFSGDMAGSRTDGSQTDLLSYGVLRVQIKDDAGNELKLATGKKATLSYPFAASIQKDAPASMPLWYFDEILGMWKEEGVATKTGDNYIGEVAHFSDWNCDDPRETGTVKGRVVCNGNDGVAGIYITVGQRKTVTDSNGCFSRIVPMNLSFDISINPSENTDLTSPNLSVPPVAAGEIYTLPDIQLANCPTYVTGTIVDCSSKPIAGTVIVVYDDKYHYYFTSTGAFKIHIPPGVPMTLEATTYKGDIGLSVAVPSASSGEIYSVGTITTCGNGTTAEVFNIKCDKRSAVYTQLSHDGSLIAIFSADPSGGAVEIYEVKTGIMISSFVDNRINGLHNFTDDASKLLISLSDNTKCVMNVKTGEIIQRIPGHYQNKAILLPDGSSVISAQVPKPGVQSFSVFSVTDGSKIKDLSFAGNSNYVLAGLSGANRVQFVESNVKEVHVITWDFISDSKVFDYIFPNHVTTTYSFVEGFSPDCTIFGFKENVNQIGVNFFSSETGLKINPSLLTVSIDGQYTHNYIGIANDKTFVVQLIPREHINKEYPQPKVYNVSDGRLLKILPSNNVSFYSHFNYSSDSRYLAATENLIGTESSSVRVWKLK